jgi:hypothetical protein
MPKTTTRAEQETVLRWDEDEKVVPVWSASPVTWRKLARLGFEPYKETVPGGRGDRPVLPCAAGRVPLGPQVGPRRQPGQPRLGSGDPGRKPVSRAQTIEVGV